jgi:hypothetical protein
MLLATLWNLGCYPARSRMRSGGGDHRSRFRERCNWKQGLGKDSCPLTLTFAGRLRRRLPLGCWELFHELVVGWEGIGVAASTVEPLKWFLRRDGARPGFCCGGCVAGASVRGKLLSTCVSDTKSRPVALVTRCIAFRIRVFARNTRCFHMVSRVGVLVTRVITSGTRAGAVMTSVFGVTTRGLVLMTRVASAPGRVLALLTRVVAIPGRTLAPVTHFFRRLLENPVLPAACLGSGTRPADPRNTEHHRRPILG